MAVKMPVDLTQNGNTRRSLQQATDLDDRRDPSISPINPPNRALRSQVRRKVSGRLHYKRGQGTILGGVFAINRLWRELSRRGQPKKSTPVDILPRRITHEGVVLEQHIREGRFQRSLALITAFSALLAGLEVTYEHYRGSYSQRIMYSPILLTPVMCIAALWAVFSRRVARTLLPIASIITIADGITGFFFHIRGIHRKPGGWRIPVFNVIMGPPLFAPLLYGLSGFLGLITAFLRREDAPEYSTFGGLLKPRPTWMRLLPGKISREGLVFEQDIREGRFQRMLGVATAISAFFSGVESLYSHYKNNFTYRVQWTPILLTPVLMIAGFGTVWSRSIARTLLPISSLLALLNGSIGFFYHVRGVLRRPGGTKKLLYNIIYGPPIFAPLLFAASGFLGLLASLLRREAQCKFASELDRVPGSGTLKARKTHGTSVFTPLEEVGKRAMETFERGINHHRRQIRMGLFAMPLVLLVQVQVLARLFVVRDQLLKTGIVHRARGNQGFHQGLFLCPGWAKAVLKCSHNSSIAHND